MKERLLILIAIIIGLGISISPMGKYKYLRNIGHFMSLLKNYS